MGFLSLGKDKMIVVDLPDDPRRVLYVETHKSEGLERYVKSNLERIKKFYSDCGLDFVYVPELMDLISGDGFAEIAKFYAPWINKERINELQKTFVTDLNALNQRVISESNASVAIDSEGEAFVVNYNSDNYDAEFEHLAIYALEKANKRARQAYNRAISLFEENRQSDPSPNPVNAALTPAQNVIAANVMAAEKGKEIISSLVVEDKKKPIITLPEYEMEIKLERRTSFAFYLLFLHHPEGIRFCDIPDYREELIRYYHPVAKSHHNVEGPVLGMIEIDGQNQQMSWSKNSINRAFRGHMFEDYSQYYIINGHRNEEYSIEVAKMRKVTLPDYN